MPKKAPPWRVELVVKMRCRQCNRVLERFAPDDQGRDRQLLRRPRSTWVPLWQLNRKDRPAGSRWPDDAQLAQSIRGAGFAPFRCHERCGYEVVVSRADIARRCTVVAENGASEFFV